MSNPNGPWTLPAATQVLGRVIDAVGTPLDDGGPLAAVTFVQSGSPPSFGERFETGIKALDVLLPLTHGSVVSISSGAGLGKLVLLAGLVERMAQFAGGAAVLVGAEEHTLEVTDMMRMMRESNVHQHLAMVFARRDDDSTVRTQAIATGWHLAEELHNQGRPVVLLIDRQLAIQVKATSRRPANAAITLLYFDHQDEPTAASSQPDFDVQIVLSRELAERKIWPAIDVVASSSRWLDTNIITADQRTLVQQVRAAIRHLLANDATIEPFAQHLLNYQAQPFFVAELYTGKPGEYVPLPTALRDYAALLAGQYNEQPVKNTYFIGALSQ